MSQPTPPFRSKNPPCRTQPTQLTQLSLYICVYARSFLITDRIIFKNINNRKKLCRVARLCRRQGSRSPFHPSEAARHPDFSLHSSGSIHKAPSSKKFFSIYMSKMYPPKFTPFCDLLETVHISSLSSPIKIPGKNTIPLHYVRAVFSAKVTPSAYFFLLLSQQKKKTAFSQSSLVILHSFRQFNDITRSPCTQLHVTVRNCTIYEKKEHVLMLFSHFNDITRSPYTQLYVTIRNYTIYEKRVLLTLFSIPLPHYNPIIPTGQ